MSTPRSSENLHTPTLQLKWLVAPRTAAATRGRKRWLGGGREPLFGGAVMSRTSPEQRMLRTGSSRLYCAVAARRAFQEWSEAFPDGISDGHGSIIPASDHLFYMGLTRCAVEAVYGMLSDDQRLLAEVSLRGSRSKARLQRTRVLNFDKGSIYKGIKVSEWAAVLAVGPMSLRRVLRTGATSAALEVVLDVLSKLQALVNSVYYFPRVDLDGADACQVRPSHKDLFELADAFMSAFVAAFLRPDCICFASIIDVPNLHRLREVLNFSFPALLHVRHSQELAFESAHQFIKRAMRRGNGRDDARRAMVRVVESELVSCLRLEPAYFGIEKIWTALAGVKEALKAAYPLWSEESAPWQLSGPIVTVANGSERAESLAKRFCGTGALRWRARATRGGDEWVTSGDAVRVLVTSDASSLREYDDFSKTLRERDTKVAYFGVVALCSSASGLVTGIVNLNNEEDDTLRDGDALPVPGDESCRATCAGCARLRHLQIERKPPHNALHVQPVACAAASAEWMIKNAVKWSRTCAALAGEMETTKGMGR